MHNSKKWLKLFACVLVGACIIKLLDFVLYPCTFVRNDIHTITTEQKDVLILGTSNGMSDLDPDSMLQTSGLSGHNLCVGGQYPVDAYYIAKLAIEKQKPKTIIFELSPGYFTTEKEKGNNYLLFYHEFPISLTKAEYYMNTMLDCDFRSPLFAFHEYPLSYELSKIPDTIRQKTDQTYGIDHLRSKTQEYHENGFVEKYPVAVENFPAYSPTLFSATEVKDTNMQYLSKLIALCKENDIEFIATTMPISAVMLVEEADSYNEAWDYFSAYFKDQDVPYYNFNREYYDAYNHDLANYVDYDGHMNGDSAKQFSAVFGEIVFQNK